jgi:hypothetical protein
MEVVPTLKENFGSEHFGAVQLGDRRRNARLVQVAQRLIEYPDGSLPKRMKDHAQLTALYRLMDAPQVTHQAVLRPHAQRTLQEMRQHPVVLLVHDSTELDYNTHKILQNLGQIGNGSRRGYICHNSLAITPQRQILGLPSQILHVRREVPAGETPRQKRDHPERESRLWLLACEAIGGPGPGSRWIDIADRGSDSFEFIAFEIRHDREFVIRSARDRRLFGQDHVGADRIYQKLHAYTRDLPLLGQRNVHVAAVAGKHKAREAQVRVAAGPVSLQAPHFVRGQAQETSLDLWVIHVQEMNPPAQKGVEPLEWILLSNLPTNTFEQACERIEYYQCRWLIEDYHKGIKTGASVQDLQFEQEQRLEPMIALLSVVSVTLLQLRHLARQPEAQQTPARAIVPRLYVRVLSAQRTGKARDDLSVYQFCMMLGGLGGHLGRKGDGFPGWLTLWRGWNDLMLMVKGVQALHPMDAEDV